MAAVCPVDVFCELAVAEAELRAEQAQRSARDDIAREIHDVLGHRLSLLSLHAGALEYRPGAPPEDVARAAAVIRENAHQALQDLREVVGVLRAPVGQAPQPTSADLPRLLAEFGVRFDPVGAALGRGIPWAADVVFRLAFHHV